MTPAPEVHPFNDAMEKAAAAVNTFVVHGMDTGVQMYEQNLQIPVLINRHIPHRDFCCVTGPDPFYTGFHFSPLPTVYPYVERSSFPTYLILSHSRETIYPW